MLSNLKIRNKLIAILAAPIVALVVLAGIGANSRNQTASLGKRDTRIIHLAQVMDAAEHNLELEASLSVALIARPDGVTTENPAVRKELTAQRKRTDVAIKAARLEVAKFGKNDLKPNTQQSLNDAMTVLDGVAAQRPTVNQLGGETWLQSRDSYVTLPGQNSMLGFLSAIATESSTPAVGSQLQALSALANLKVATSRLSMSAVGYLQQGRWFRNSDAAGGIDKATALQSAHSDWLKLGNDVTTQQQVLQSVSASTVDNIKSTVSGPSFSNFDSVTQLLATLSPQDGSQTSANQLKQNAFGSSITRFAPTLWQDSTTQINQYRKVQSAAETTIATDTARLEHNAQRAAQLFILFAGLIVVLAIAAAVVVARSITRPVKKLTTAAHRLSREQLPRLVDSLKNPAEEDVGYLAASFTPIDVSGRDEIGQLADAFNGVQEVAVNVATEQASLLRKGIGDMFVNLARRNQTLLDRQIEFIDQLESKEEDPDQLENLFRLDHLATRMRRNAESLLVLAGAEPNRRRGKPVPLADVVRAAVGEVEDFARIDMLQFDEVLVASNAALDIAHLLSELMENAANFSPPDTRVEVVGHRTKAEGYVISIADHGIGMSPEQVNEANELLSRPPLVGLALSRSLGFIVIGRLASRFGIAVRLMPSPSGGTTAMVSLPPTLITDQPKSPSGPGAIQGGTAAPELPSAPDDISTLRDAPAPTGEKGTPRRKPAAAKSSGPADVASLVADAKAAEHAPPVAPRRGGQANPPRAPRKTPTPAEAKTNGGTPAPAAAPTNGTAAPAAGPGGLTKRVPRAAGGERAVPGGENVRAATTTRRSPEEVRSMLSNYRSGMQRGRAGEETETTPEDTES